MALVLMRAACDFMRVSFSCLKTPSVGILNPINRLFHAKIYSTLARTNCFDDWQRYVRVCPDYLDLGVHQSSDDFGFVDVFYSIAADLARSGCWHSRRSLESKIFDGDR